MMDTTTNGSKMQQLIAVKNLEMYEGALRTIESLRAGSEADFQFFLASPRDIKRPDILEQAKRACKVTEKEYKMWARRYERIRARAIA